MIVIVIVIDTVIGSADGVMNVRDPRYGQDHLSSLLSQVEHVLA